MALLTFNFESQYLNNNHEISVILPDKPREVEPAAFYGSGKKYKVLWLLHGTTATGSARATSSSTPAKRTSSSSCPAA